MISRTNRILSALSKLSLGLSVARHAPWWLGYATARRHNSSDETHARAAVDWLLFAARQGGDGVAHSLHLARGWLPAYPETTGYIIPTLLLAAGRYGWAEAETAAIAAWNWLRGIQRNDGGFVDLAGQPQVFDTGQILIGLNMLCARGVPGADAAAAKAADWLCRQQAADGSFVRHAYNDQPHAYYARVGAALVEAGQRLGLAKVGAAGLRNLEWTLGQQATDGWFRHMSFAKHPPFSHTIVYTLEGLLAGHRLSGDQRLLAAVVSLSRALRVRISADGGVIRSQYREGLVAVDDQVCVTGLCQWAAHCFRLSRLGDPELATKFASEGRRSLEAAKALQMHSPLAALHGALPGSVPLAGRYMRFALPNWGVKFFLDALLEAGAGDLPPLV